MKALSHINTKGSLMKHLIPLSIFMFTATCNTYTMDDDSSDVEYDVVEVPRGSAQWNMQVPKMEAIANFQIQSKAALLTLTNKEDSSIQVYTSTISYGHPICTAYSLKKRPDDTYNIQKVEFDYTNFKCDKSLILEKLNVDAYTTSNAFKKLAHAVALSKLKELEEPQQVDIFGIPVDVKPADDGNSQVECKQQ
jgi:hypothetical protein